MNSMLLPTVCAMSDIFSGACSNTSQFHEDVHCSGWDKVPSQHCGPEQHQGKGEPLLDDLITVHTLHSVVCTEGGAAAQTRWDKVMSSWSVVMSP